MKLKQVFVPALAIASFLCANTVSVAADFEFGITFDGASASVDSKSMSPAGAKLIPGDSFVVDIHVSTGNFWRVDAPYSEFFPLTFVVQPSGERIGKVVSSFLLNGVEVDNVSEPAVNQQEVHVGAQNWTLPERLEFDQVLLSYKLKSATDVNNSDPVNTTINDEPMIFGAFGNPERPFFRHSSISFNVVPEPTALCLAVIGLLGIAAVRRK